MNADIKSTVTKGTMVRHATSGAYGIVIGVWVNIAGQEVYNVKIVHNRQRASWNSMSVMGGAA